MPKRLIIAGLFSLCVLPGTLRAEEKSDCKICVEGQAEAEFNFLDSGNSRVFSTRDSVGSTYPTRDTVGPEDRVPFVWRSAAQIYVTHRYFEVWISPYGDWNGFGWPKSVGLYYSMMARLAYAEMKFGLYHHSAHNVVEERYGKGTSTTGAHLAWDVWRENGFAFIAWGTYNFHEQNETPFVFTARTKEMPKADLEGLYWAAGTTSRITQGNCELTIPIAVHASKSGIASVRVRSQTLYKFKKSFELGPYVEYDANVRETSKFGRDEWLCGIILKSSL